MVDVIKFQFGCLGVLFGWVFLICIPNILVAEYCKVFFCILNLDAMNREARKLSFLMFHAFWTSCAAVLRVHYFSAISP